MRDSWAMPAAERAEDEEVVARASHVTGIGAVKVREVDLPPLDQRGAYLPASFKSLQTAERLELTGL